MRLLLTPIYIQRDAVPIRQIRHAQTRILCSNRRDDLNIRRFILSVIYIMSVCLSSVSGSGLPEDGNVAPMLGSQNAVNKYERTAASLLREANCNSLAPVTLEGYKPVLTIPMRSKAGGVRARITDSVDTPRRPCMRRTESRLLMETNSIET
ncbi:hypothetical protein [Candidatus Bodocaedibacter vickermanii]